MTKEEKEIFSLRRSLYKLRALFFHSCFINAYDLAQVANEKLIHDSNMFANPTPNNKEYYLKCAELFDNARLKQLEKADIVKNFLEVEK